MFIKTLSLEKFRSWPKYNLEFKEVTILIGKNGVGKTNILEAINLLSTGRSWRTAKDVEVIEWEKEYSRLTAKITGNVLKYDLELFLQRHLTKEATQPKMLKINGVKKRLIDLLGVLPTVLFSPESIEILDGPPNMRRRFLDILLSQTSREYALNLLEYTKVLRGRNKLLMAIKMGRSKYDELDFWDEKVITLGKVLIDERETAVEFFNGILNNAYSSISGAEDKLIIKYRGSVDINRFEEMLFANRERDVEQITTNCGPHRDDLIFMLDNRDVTTFGSRGEFRSVVLALKMAELEFISQKLDERPILLLDDIFSELDHDRRMHLAKIVSGQQTIITTTDLDHIEPELQKRAKIVSIEGLG